MYLVTSKAFCFEKGLLTSFAVLTETSGYESGERSESVKQSKRKTTLQITEQVLL